jgi:hypothetical protein
MDYIPSSSSTFLILSLLSLPSLSSFCLPSLAFPSSTYSNIPVSIHSLNLPMG